MKINPSFILSFTLISLWSCSDFGEPIIKGCTDSNACNYSIDNTHDDGSCWTPLKGCSCADAQGTIVDECGVCGGSGLIDNNHDCNGNCIVSLDICGTCGGTVNNPENCCSEGQNPDCNGECGGSAVSDCNGVCGGSAINDCLGVCSGSAVIDNCSVCDGDNSSCVNYSTEIQPIFNASCTSCHGSSGGINLESYSNLKSGGDSGPVVISGNGPGSFIIQKLRGTASGNQMPVSGCCLDESVIQLIETWINEGALDN